MMRGRLIRLAAGGILPILLAVLALLGCVGGGNSGSETTNGLTGVIKDVEGRPVAGARVLLLPEEFNPAEDDTGGFPLRTATNAKGVYTLEDVAPGQYHLEISDIAHGTLTLIQDVEVASDGGLATLDATLGKPGALQVRIVDFLEPDEDGYVYIPGTLAFARVDSGARASGSLDLDRVPVGRFPKLLLVADDGGDSRIITLARDFEVLAESTVTTAPFQTWAYSRAITINTASLGVTGDVADFPLLVRLTAVNFDFAQAQPDGRDLRFTGADGASIPFQIERWDPGAKRAEIWARVAKVAGNTADQAIRMHWGRGLASAPAGGVFDPAVGFATVFHLDEAANEDSGGYKDATPNGNHATAKTVNPDAQIPGVIGSAKAFAGKPLDTKGVLTAGMPKGFAGNSSYTVSFWMRYDTTSTRQTVMDFGNYATLKDVHYLIRHDSLTQFGPYDGDKTSGRDPATWQNVFKIGLAGRWTHVANVYDAARGVNATYINGDKVDEVACPPLQLEAGASLRIGKTLETHPLDTPFNGALDEIRFHDRALTADRIKLDFETQKP